MRLRDIMLYNSWSFCTSRFLARIPSLSPVQLRSGCGEDRPLCKLGSAGLVSRWWLKITSEENETNTASLWRRHKEEPCPELGASRPRITRSRTPPPPPSTWSHHSGSASFLFSQNTSFLPVQSHHSRRKSREQPARDAFDQRPEYTAGCVRMLVCVCDREKETLTHHLGRWPGQHTSTYNEEHPFSAV